MKKVFLLYEIVQYEGEYVKGVFSSEEKAIEWWEKTNRAKWIGEDGRRTTASLWSTIKETVVNPKVEE